MAGLSDLAESLRLALAAIEEAQRASLTTQDKCDEAVRQAGAGTEGSSSDLVVDAVFALADAHTKAQESVINLQTAHDKLSEYMAARGMGAG